MTRHVVLLTNAHEAPATTLTDVLHGVGVAAFVEGMREMDTPASIAIKDDGAGDGVDAAPLAVLYEVIPGADMRELYSVIEHASAVWPSAPLVACRRPVQGNASPSLRTLDTATLKRLGFRAIADEPAQLPALLRELEDRGMTGDLVAPGDAENAWLPATLLLPEKISRSNLRAAFELVASLHLTNDQSSAANAALAGLASIIEADRWTIYLTSETSRNQEASLEPLAVRGSTAHEGTRPEQDWQRALLGNALALSGLESKAARESVVKALTLRKTEGQKRIVAVPLFSGERVMGVLEGVREASESRSFTKATLRLLDALALPIASALGNSLRIAEAERLSQTDDLTKLHNARYLRQFLLGEVRRARRYNSSVAALFFDLDDFKNVNDGHGHLVGSHVLMEMAAIILSSVRDTDVVARYGGDEFVVVLPESNVEQAAFVAERVRRKIEKNNFTGGRGLRLQLTASFGVATFPRHAQSPQQLVANADAAMYEAKAAGKNCLRFAPSPQTANDEALMPNVESLRADVKSGVSDAQPTATGDRRSTK
ncbi:MAG TPA: diguanylate cyclase [Pyrinomonadaceae bacterium]|jgi:diguanylate cyclase (GGDEF)-like protein|nr:diguanylate cyclase [Pyrinomonadaceae bacterium]